MRNLRQVLFKSPPLFIIGILLINSGASLSISLARAAEKQTEKLEKQTEKSAEKKKRVLSPSLFHLTEVSGSNCDDKTKIVDENRKFLGLLCPDELKKCVSERSCFYDNGEDQMILRHVAENRFKRFPVSSKCPYGPGAKDVCLDPYYSVAADAAFYKVGDVLFIDSLRGVKLPDGSYHTGYVIVRDTPENIKGENNLEFFVGTAALDDKNPFSRLGFGDSEGGGQFEFTKISDAEKIQQTLKSRDYPNAIVGTFSYPNKKPSSSATTTPAGAIPAAGSNTGSRGGSN